MSKLVDRYQNWTEFGKNMFILLMVGLVGALVCVGFIFVDNVGVLLGWLLGTVVNIFAYFTIHKSSAALLGQKESKFGYMAMLGGALRLLLYAGTLLLAGFASFRWGSLAHGYCNLISCALALMPTWIMLVLTMFLRGKKQTKNTEGEGK